MEKIWDVEEVAEKVKEIVKGQDVEVTVKNGKVLVKGNGKWMAIRKFEDWRVQQFFQRVKDIFGYDSDGDIDFSNVRKEVRKMKKEGKKKEEKVEENEVAVKENDTNGVMIDMIGGVKCIVQRPQVSNVEGIEFKDIFEALDFSSEIPIVIQGEKGIGKSYTVLVWANKRGIPYFRVDCSEDMTVSDMLGSFIVLDGEVYYKFSALGSALYWAMKGEEVLVIFEELNVLPPSTMKGLNSLFDFKRSLLIPELGKVLGGKSLRIVATINDSSYMGTYDFSDDIKSRLLIVNISSDKERRKKLLKYDFGTLSDLEEKIVKVIDEMNKQMAQDYFMEYRDIQKFIRVARILKEKGKDDEEIFSEIVKFMAYQYSNVKDAKGLLFQMTGIEVR